MNRRLRTFFGWIVILAISLVPVFLWFNFGAGTSEFGSYGDTVHSLGELFGLVGMTMFALTFVLSTRIKAIEDVFGGLDKVYIVHGILGGTALILILSHPIFLVLKFVPSDFALAASYLLPSSYWSINFGILALVGMVTLIYITLFTKMKYNRWKFTHEFLGLMFLFTVLHTFLVRGTISSDNIFDGYYIFASVVSFIGLGAFSYSLFIKNRLVKNAVYRISEIKRRRDVFTIEMKPEHKPIKYKSGQFVFLRFYNEKLSKEAHPFSIASASNNETLRIIVKKLGDYTSRIEHLKIGDKVSIEGPYGRFNFENHKGKNQVWISAGIGITPFLGMVHDLEGKNVNIDLYHIARDDSDFIGYDVFLDVESKNKNFRFFPWNSSKRGRINVQDIGMLSGDFKGREFFLCGPHKFKEDLIRNLIKVGVKKKNIHEEAFDFR